MSRGPANLFVAIMAAGATIWLTPALAAVVQFRAAPEVLHHDVSAPLREMAAAARASVGAPPGDPVVQSDHGVTAMPPLTIEFNAPIGAGGANPPSPSADVGPNHYVLMANPRLMVFDKSGATLLGPVNNNTIWAGFGGPCETANSGNPTVLYDQVADRWILAQLGSLIAPYSICLAVSTSGDPLGSYHRWSLGFGDHRVDFQRFAVGRDAIYLSTTEFVGSTHAGNGVYAIERADLIAGAPALSIVSFLVPPGTKPYITGEGFTPADLDGSRLPPPGSPGYFLGLMDNGGPFVAPEDALTLWRLHADFVNPAASTLTHTHTIPVETFDSIYPCTPTSRACLPQPGAVQSQYLDILSYRQRLLPRVTYRNHGTYETILANHSVEAAPSMAGIRWYELRDPGVIPFIHQQGTYAPGTFDGVHRWNGALASDHQGNIALGFSVTGVTTFPGIRFAGRLVSDPLGTLAQGEGTIVDGGGIQTSTSNRWGNYSSMSIDPIDDCTFWYVNEYYPVTSGVGWMLRVGAFKYSGCTPAVSVEDGGPAPTTLRLEPIGLATGPVEIRFEIAGPALRPVRVDVLDVSGRVLRRLLEQPLTGGRYRLSWDRSSERGGRVPSGVYYVRLRAENDKATRAAVLVR